MGFSTSELIPEMEDPDGFSFKITIETGMLGLARINVACIDESTDEEENSQGADLSPAECRALAHMLLSTAELVSEESIAPDDDDGFEMPLADLVDWLETEFGGKVISVMPSIVEVDPIGETYWVVFESEGKRTIEWIIGAKSVSEGSGPAAHDCPIAFFDLAPEVNLEWRKKCIEYDKSL